MAAHSWRSMQTAAITNNGTFKFGLSRGRNLGQCSGIAVVVLQFQARSY
jgi:hypothetical protein